jgi:hypothetical protein
LRIWPTIIGGWLIIMVCIFVLPNMFHKASESVTASRPMDVLDKQGGPVIGDSGSPEKVRDVVMAFLNLINEGKLDEAATYVDGNHLLILIHIKSKKLRSIRHRVCYNDRVLFVGQY